MRIIRGLGVAAVVVALAATSVLGANITSIGVLTPFDADAPMSKVYALSPDGQYVVGESLGQNRAADGSLGQAVIWSTASGLVQMPNDPPAPYNEFATSARGVVVKANGDVGVAAYYISTDRGTGTPITDSYRMNHYTASPGNLGGGTHVMSEQKGGPLIGEYNAARMYENGSGNDWVIAGRRPVADRAELSFSFGTYADSGTLTGFRRVYNVASRVPTGTNRGFGAGYETQFATNNRRATFGIGGSTQFVIPGVADVSVGSSETLGMSPYTTSDAGTGVLVGYDVGGDGNPQAFYYSMGGIAGDLISLNGTRTLLPRMAGETESAAIDIRLIGGNMLIGGYSSDGTTETAVLWDTTGIWDATGQPVALASLVNMADWSSLSRVTSMSDDGKTLAGWGIWAADGTTRGFVVVIPEPATLSLLVLGGLAMLRRRG